MSVLAFTIHGETAFWRDVEDSVGYLSCLGPAPSHILGIIGACFGWSSTNQSNGNTNLYNRWPYSAQLMKWVSVNKPKVAARITKPAIRISMNVNGIKNAKTLERTRLQQTVLDNPEYQIAIESGDGTGVLAAALRNPVYRVCMGSHFCPAFIKNVTEIPPNSAGNWALVTPEIGADSTPLTLMDMNNPENRLHKSGYWNYLYQEEKPVSEALIDSFYAA